MGVRRASVLFFASEGASLLGNAAIMLVLPWLVLVRTQDAAAAGLVAAAAAIPGFVAAVVGGSLVDRTGRRRMTIVSDLGSAASVAALALVDATIGLGLGWFVALGILGALFDVPGMTARDAMLARVAAEAGLPLERVSGIRRALYGLAYLVAPATAGAALAFLPSTVVLAAIAGCSALAALLAFASPKRLGLPVPDEELPRAAAGPEAPAPAPFGWSTIREGFRLLAASPLALATTLLGVGAMFAIGPLQAVVLPALFARADEPGLLGASLAAVAAGLIVASLLSASLTARLGRRPVLVIALLGSLAALVAFAVAPLPAVIVPGAAVVGAGFGLIAPLLPVLVTEAIPESGRARVFGLQNAGYLAAYPAGALLVGVIVQASDVQVGAIVCAAVWAVLVVFGLLAPALRAPGLARADAAGLS